MYKGTNLNRWIVILLSFLVMGPATMGGVIYVDADANGANDGSSWADAYNYLQDALAEAQSNGEVNEIRVAEGIYTPDSNSAEPNGSGDREATFQLINGVALCGGYAGFGESDPDARGINLYKTILSGDLTGNDVQVTNPLELLTEPTRAENSYHVFYHPEGMNLDNTAILDGFIVSGGNANGSYPHAEGGGMFNKYNSPSVTNCIFEDNSVAATGGGMYNVYSSPQITNCTFFSNSGGTGGGMRNTRCEPLIANCIFSNNHAMGSPWGRPIGGGISNYTYPEGSHKPTIINCTFTGNIAGGGGGMHNDGSRPSVANCIFWSNSPQQITGAATITHSDVQGSWPGLGNIDSDPCFVDPGYWADACDPNIIVEPNEPDAIWVEGDYHLLAVSPCIDAGDPNYVPEPNETDLDGNPRIVGGRIDMGAYEFESLPAIEVAVKISPNTLNLQSKGKWIMCVIWLPEDYNVADIDVNSILLEDEVPAERVWFSDEFAVVKFSRAVVQEMLAELETPAEVELVVSGELSDGTIFEGADTIRVIDVGGGKNIDPPGKALKQLNRNRKRIKRP